MNLIHEGFPLLKETWNEFQEDNAGQLGAALSYYAMFSIFPLLLLLLAVLGFLLRFWDAAVDVEQEILRTAGANFSPQFSDSLKEALAVVRQQAGGATGVGLVFLMLGASGVFQQLDQSFNIIWDVPERPKQNGLLNTIKATLSERLFSFGMVLGVGFLLLISLALTGITTALLGTLTDLPVVGRVLGFFIGLLVTLGLNTLIFALLFKYLPDTNVSWGDVWLGALLTALIWEVAKRLLAIYIGQSSYASAYGAVGTVLVLMTWIYFSSQVLFLGAEFTQVYARHHGSRAQQQQPAQQPPAHEQEQPAAPQRAVPPGTKRVVATTGAALLIGMVGGVAAGLAALVIGARRAISGATRWMRH